MIRKNTNLLITTEKLATSISIFLLFIFSITLLINSLTTLSESQINVELCNALNNESELPVGDCDSHKKESKDSGGEFILNKKTIVAATQAIKSHNPVPHKLLFENRITELLTPPPEFN